MKMAQRKGLAVPRKGLWLIGICALLIFNVPTAFCQSKDSSHPTPLPKSTSVPLGNMKPKLKLCAPQHGESVDTSLVNRALVKIPAFTTGSQEYELHEFRIDAGNPLKTCPNGKPPVTTDISVPIKADFDEESQISHVLELLRLVSVIFDNGYLSVGNPDERTSTFYPPNEFCLASVEDKAEHITASFRICNFSENKLKLPKCCPVGIQLDTTHDAVCEGFQEKWDFKYMDRKTYKFLEMDSVNPVVTSPILLCPNGTLEVWDGDNCDMEFHPVTDGSIAYIGAYRKWEFLKASTEWCIDTAKTKAGLNQFVMFHCADNDTNTKKKESNQARISLLYMMTMYVGAGFHFLTTLVYLITWPKQNIHGKTLCSCTTSLFFMQLFLGTAHLLGRIGNQRKKLICIGNGILGQYFMIAAFTWLLVVNFDLWKTFRSMRHETSKGSKRFLMYSTFGWIFPLIVSAISISLDFTFTCRNSGVPVPEFGEYYCFVAPWAQGFYVYYLLGALIALSYLFAAVTLFGLYTFKKDTANLRSNRGAQDQQNVLLFLKLSVVMGLTWIFEVISWAATGDHQNHIYWIALDLYNALSAILIFFIFVCKKTTLNMLEQSVPALKGITATLSKLSSPFTKERTSDVTNSTVANSSTHKKSFDGPVVQFKKTVSKEAENSGTSQAD